MRPGQDKDFLLWWLGPALACLAIALAWSNHFGNGFHWEDVPASGGAFAAQVETFLWFIALLLSLYVVFRSMPGGSHLSAVAAAALFGLHPAIADTLNYISRRGEVIVAFAVAASLAIWIVWPRLLPARLWAVPERTVENWQEDLTRKAATRRNTAYQRFIQLPLGLYLIPVALVIPLHPVAAVFAPLLAAYMWVFEPRGSYRRLLPSALLCGVGFPLALWLTRAPGQPRVSAAGWFATEPWVAARAVFHFFAPLDLSPDSGLRALTPSEWPLMILGLAVLAALAGMAWYAARHEHWRGVSFGLWWFLIAFAFSVLSPGRIVEENSRMFLPFIGLALAVICAARTLLADRDSLSLALAAVVLSAAGWTTFERNKIWASDADLWETAAAKSPLNARALTHAAVAALSDSDPERARQYLSRAEPLVAGDAALETDLALVLDRAGDTTRAGTHFRHAIAADPAYAPAYSGLSQWLLDRQRTDEAFAAAMKASALDPADVAALHTLIDVYSERSDWEKVKETATRALAAHPDDSASQRSLTLATATIEETERLAATAAADENPNEFLKLSSLYFQRKRYADSLTAAQSALKLKESGEAWANISAADHELGKDDEAIAALREVIRLRPDMGFAKGNLDYLLAKKTESGASPAAGRRSEPPAAR